MVPMSFKEVVMVKLSKEEVQQKVLHRGEPIQMNEFTWDSDTRTFNSKLDDLVLAFNYIHGVTFKTGSNCTFKTGYECTFITGNGCTFKTGIYCTFKTSYSCAFKTGHGCTFITNNGCSFKTEYDCTFKTKYDCTFKTGHGCTFKTGSDCSFHTGHGCTFKTDNDCSFKTEYDCTFDTNWNCTFTTEWSCVFDTGDRCVIVRSDMLDVVTIIESKEDTVTICPYKVPGYLINDKYYVNSEQQDGVYLIADDVLSKIINQKSNVYKVTDHGSVDVTYLVKSGELWAHGSTLAEARESLIYKISDRDTSKYDNYTLYTVISKTEAIQMYRTITGACESGVRDYVESLDEVPYVCTISELIKLTTGKYGNTMLIEFFDK